jgi:hypothetical protein
VALRQAHPGADSTDIGDFPRCEVDIETEDFGTKTPPAQDVRDSLVPSSPQQAAWEAVTHVAGETFVGSLAQGPCSST